SRPVGVITMPRAVAKKSVPAGALDPRADVRQSTEIIVFDAFHPKPIPPLFPSEITIEYVLQTVVRDVSAPGAPAATRDHGFRRSRPQAHSAAFSVGDHDRVRLAAGVARRAGAGGDQ